MAIKEIKVPDIGAATDVDVIEVFVKPGDKVEKEQSLITLEGDKATMEIPSPEAGTVKELTIKVGDKISAGSLILTLDVANAGENQTQTQSQPAAKSQMQKPADTKSKTPEIKEIPVPDIGGATNVDVIEVFVKSGDKVNTEQSLITLEGDKATMEIPSPYAGTIKEVKVNVGDKVSQGNLILIMEVTPGEAPRAEVPAAKPEEKKPEAKPAETAAPTASPSLASQEIKSYADVHAGPGVRQYARELGVDLTRVRGSGPKGRILKEDVVAFVKSELQKAKSGGFGLPPIPVIDFKKFGEIETKPLNKIKRATGLNVHRSWITVPHVTQVEEADITEMEEFRQQQKKLAEAEGVKLTPLVFIMKAVVAALKEFPVFNSSLDASGENLIYKKYYHLGVAVDTPNGLVVPVIRNVDCKGMMELAKELAEVSKKAREKGLSLTEMQGSCFTISSLGGIGGTAFTPIVNTPDVAILGVSRAAMKPVYKDNQFVPRLMLPLSLSYDHRVIDGADGARFIVFLAKHLSEIKTLLL